MNTQNFDKARFKKGIAPVIVALIVAVVLGGGVYMFMNKATIKPVDVTHSELITKYSALKDRVFAYKMVETSAPIEATGVVTVDNKQLKMALYPEGGKSFFCDGTLATVINYRTKTSRDSNAVGGDWEKIDVIDCGDYYWVHEESDAGPKLSGPFDSNEPSVSATDTANWKTYKNEKYGFELLYPVEWRVYIPQVKDVVVVLGLKAGKGNGDIDGDVFVDAYKKTEIYLDKKEDGSLKSPMETLVERTGPSDRKVIKETRTINGVQATKVTVTDPSLSGWKSEKFFIEKGDTIFVFNNGAVPKKMFEPVVLSFKFTK
ncbi:MAG: hypothetical protein Q7R79_04535 [bacterium]|nr:hypothetical protein [bacterium]